MALERSVLPFLLGLAWAASVGAQDFVDTQRLNNKVLFRREDAAEQRRDAERRRVEELDRRSQEQAVLLQQQAATVSQLGSELQQVRDERQLVELAGAFDAALAAGRWPMARALLADTVTMDLAAPPYPAAATLPADTVIADLTRVLARGGVVPRANQHVQFDAERAVLTSDGYGWAPMLRSRERFGSWEYRFARTAQGWRIDGLLFRPATPPS